MLELLESGAAMRIAWFLFKKHWEQDIAVYVIEQSDWPRAFF